MYSLSALGQNCFEGRLDYSGMSNQGDFDFGEWDEIREGVIDFLDAYCAEGGLYDGEMGGVTLKSQKLFEELFIDNARIYDDISYRTTGEMDVSDYVRMVQNDFKNSGLNFVLRDVKILSVEKDSDYSKPQYFTRISMTKFMKNGYDRSAEATNYDSPRAIENLILVLKTYKEDSGFIVTRIASVEGPREKLRPRSGISFGVHYGSLMGSSTTKNNFYDTDDIMSVNSYSTLGVELLYTLGLGNRERKDEANKFFLNLGFGIRSHSVVNITDDRVDYVAGSVLPYELVFESFEDQISITSFDLLAGVSARLMDSRSSNLFLNGTIIYTINQAANNLGLRTGGGEFLDNYTPLICGIGADFSSGGQFMDMNAENRDLWENLVGLNHDPAAGDRLDYEYESTSTLSFRIGPEYQFDVSGNKLRVSIGLDYTLNITDLLSLYDAPAVSSPFDLEGSPGTADYSLSQSYFDSYKLSTIGGKLGLIYYLSR